MRSRVFKQTIQLLSNDIYTFSKNFLFPVLAWMIVIMLFVVIVAVSGHILDITTSLSQHAIASIVMIELLACIAASVWVYAAFNKAKEIVKEENNKTVNTLGGKQ